MTEDNTEILTEIGPCYYKNGDKEIKVKFPGNISFTKSGSTVLMKISSDAILKNMQSDENAFEGWALVLKRWCKFEKVIITWESKNESDIYIGHYQRFLYRVTNFSQDFKEWFSVEQKSIALLNDLKIKESGSYLLNSPGKNRTNAPYDENSNKEKDLELRFTNPPWSDELKNITDASFIDRQLPVGIFNEKIKKDNSIFTGGKSAIDLWGISKNYNELLLFELKGSDNNKIGIISELYFYSCIMRWLKSGPGQLKQKKTNDCLQMMANPGKIKAYFLVPKIHPLIDSELVQILNDGLSPEIEFDYLLFEEDSVEGSIKKGF